MVVAVMMLWQSRRGFSFSRSLWQRSFSSLLAAWLVTGLVMVGFTAKLSEGQEEVGWQSEVSVKRGAEAKARQGKAQPHITRRVAGTHYRPLSRLQRQVVVRRM